jgi:gamma-glutamyl-gamma-aminobutyrate hydrolase PuuD
VSIEHARPLVIIPARFSEDASALRYEAEVAAAKLVEAVWDAGGEPLVVHPTALGESPIEAMAQRFWMAEGLLLPGGGDVSPRWYGQKPHPTLHGVNETQDAFDLALARWAIRDKVPLLAICGGNQLVNVAGHDCGVRRGRDQAGTYFSGLAQQRVDSCSDEKQRQVRVRPVEKPHRLQCRVSKATPRPSQ